MMWTGAVEGVDFGSTAGPVQNIVIDLFGHPMAAGLYILRITGTAFSVDKTLIVQR